MKSKFKSIAKSLRATKRHVSERYHKYNLTRGIAYRDFFSCNCIKYGTGDYAALGYYESIYQFGYDTFCSDLGLNEKQAYTARIMALELAALLAEEGQNFS